MPSTTSNYGWTYPISSDDLNAGATAIGSLATGADSSLKAEANTRASADGLMAADIDYIANTLVPTKTVTTWMNGSTPVSVTNITVSYAAVTTDSNGRFTLGPTFAQCMVGNVAVSASLDFPVFVSGIAGSTTFTCWQVISTGAWRYPGATVWVTVLSW